MASLQELTAQVVALTDQVQTLNSRLMIALQNSTLQTQTMSRGGRVCEDIIQIDDSTNCHITNLVLIVASDEVFHCFARAI